MSTNGTSETTGDNLVYDPTTGSLVNRSEQQRLEEQKKAEEEAAAAKAQVEAARAKAESAAEQARKDLAKEQMKQMLRDGMPPKLVAKYTGFAEEEVQKVAYVMALLGDL